MSERRPSQGANFGTLSQLQGTGDEFSQEVTMGDYWKHLELFATIEIDIDLKLFQ